MGNGGQRPYPFRHSATLQLCHAVLRDNGIHQVPSNGHRRPRRQRGLDLGDRPLFGGGIKGDDPTPAFGAQGAGSEIRRTASAAELLGADGLRGHLAQQIDLQTGVDGDHAGR